MVLAFGQYRLDIERRELRCGADLADLEPKAFDLLVFLVQNCDRVVSKDDLLQALWQGRIVSELALTTRINAVRRAVGDDGRAQRLIRTFTRKGIRFVGEVTQVADRSLPNKPSIAVLPFQNLSGDPEQDYFADGMVEEITTAIARCPGLFVIARNSSLRLQGQECRCETGSTGTWRALRARRLRQKGRRPGAHWRPADRFDDRRAHLGRPL